MCVVTHCRAGYPETPCVLVTLDAYTRNERVQATRSSLNKQMVNSETAGGHNQCQQLYVSPEAGKIRHMLTSGSAITLSS